MAASNSLLTYGDASIQTDIVRGAVEILSAQVNDIYSMLGKTTAISMLHQFSTDTLDAAGSGAVEQSQDFTYGTLTTPTMLQNLVQEVAKPIRVSRPQNAVAHYHGQSELKRQTSKALINFTNAVEFDLIRSTLVSGVSGTIQKMMGIMQAISKSTNTSAHNSGTVFSATILDGVMQDNWTNSNGDVATDVFVGGTLKRVTDYFVAKSNVVVGGADVRKIVKTVTTYETAMGTVTFHKHRYVQQPSDTTSRVLGVRPEKLKVAFLETPRILDNLTVGGAYFPLAVYGSLTLETRNQDSNFFYNGFLLTA